MKYLPDEEEESSNVAIFRPNFDKIILGTVGSEASRNKLKEFSGGLGMNKTFLLPFYSRKSRSKVCKNFNIWSTTNQERPVLVHCKFIYQNFYGRPI